MTPHEAVIALVAAGWSESRIAREAKTSQPTIHRIKRGEMPRGPSFAVSQAVIELAEREAQGVDGGTQEANPPARRIPTAPEATAEAAPAVPLSEAA